MEREGGERRSDKEEERLARVLLVEPNYYTRYPPLGLLKLASYRRANGDRVMLVRGLEEVFVPDEIYVTSLFSYSWRPVHRVVQAYRKRYSNAFISLGGIYASLMPEHAALSGADEIHVGLHLEAEGYLPAWDLVPQWDASILFAARGCVRRCGFCSVPKLEGPIREPVDGIRAHVYPGHTKIVLWDNNILGVPTWRDIFHELAEIGLEVDFNQGLDARLVTDEVAEALKELNIPRIRLAYDYNGVGRYVEKALERIEAAGFSRRSVVVYTLYNYIETPEDFLRRVQELLSWGAVCYPMRFEPLTSLTKNAYVSPHWTKDELESVARARRVLGFAGAFPPYKALREKMSRAENFREAFALREAKTFANNSRNKTARYGGPLDWRKAMVRQ